MNPVEPAAPWTTAWPAGIALLVLLGALWTCRRDLLPRRSWIGPGIGVALVAILVRVLWFPAFSSHLYDGHEADYLDLFLGDRAPSRGGTVLYPAMQWLYWGAGRVLQGEAWPWILGGLVPSLVSIAAGAAFVAEAGGGLAALFAALLLAIYGNHAFWSSSAYNVMLPLALGQVCLLALTRMGREGAPRFAALAAASGVLSVATRLESAVLIVPVLGVLLWRRPPRVRAWLPWLAGGGVLALCTVLPLLWPGGVPGEGERQLALAMHLFDFDYLAPWHVPLAFLLFLLPFSRRLGVPRGPLALLLAWAVANHVLLASFDDVGFRHALPSGVATAMALGLCAATARERFTGIAVVFLTSASLLFQTGAISGRFYATDVDLQASLPPDLPVLAPERPYACTLVAEDPHVAEDPPLSHFNLLDPAEAEALRARTGCLWWCEDAQDRAWSSRGILDRAMRLRHLYVLTPRAVLWDPASGYTCLLHDVGPRTPGILERRLTHP